MVNLVEAGYLALAFVVFVVAVTVGGAVLGGLQTTEQTTTCANYTTNTSCWSTAYNATGSGLTGVTNLAGQAGTIGTILGAVIIIGLLMGAFLYSKRE